MHGTFVELGAERPVLGAQPQFIGGDRRLVQFCAGLGAVLFTWKLYIAATYPVLWDEAHFAVSGAHLDLGYPDIPAGYPWLAHLVTAVAGWNVLPLRVVALLISAAIPFAIHFMAEPVVGRRNAIWAAIVSLIVPAVAMNGAIFYPESGLQLLLALMCGCLIRAVSRDGLKWWIWTGVTAALGLLVHFRFLIAGLGVALFLCADPLGRQQWRKPGLYISAAIALLGLLPSLIYNASNAWPAVQFHILNRPRFAFGLNYLMGFMATQIFMGGFVFFAVMVVAVRREITGSRNTPGASLAWTGAAIFAFYALQAPFNKKIMPHWPWLAFVPLIAFVPGILRQYVDSAFTMTDRRFRAGLVALGPLLTVLAAGGFTYTAFAQGHGIALPEGLTTATNTKSENWSLLLPFARKAEDTARARFGGEPAWATNGHAQAVHLEFPGVKRAVYTLDNPDDIATRFVVARHKWGLDRTALLRDRAGEGVVLVLQAPEFVYHEAEQAEFYHDICSHFSEIRRETTTILPPGQMEFAIYTARVGNVPDTAPRPCALLPQAYIARPALGDVLKVDDKGHYFGMAADTKGVSKVDILVDGKVAAHAHYGLDPDGVHAPKLLAYDPNYPKVQYDFDFPKGTLTKGRHVLTVVATRTDGTTFTSDPRPVLVR